MSDGIAPGFSGHFSIAGAQLLADPAGGLYWPNERALIVADLHLEKGAAFAARGVPLPPYDTPDTLEVVARLMRRHDPELVIALGDSFHRADSHERMADDMRSRVAALTGGCRWAWVRGNHDPDPPAGLGGECVDELRLGPLVLRHAPGMGGVGSLGEIAGHLHPVARLRQRGRVIRRRCFAVGHDRVVMPATGAFAGGLNVLDPAFAPVFPDGRFHALMLGARRIYPLAASRLIVDRGPVPERRAV